MELLEIAVPFFIALLLGEILLDKFVKKKFYRLNDTLNNLSLGIMQQVFGVFIQAFLFVCYIALLETISIQVLFEAPAIESTWYWWIVCFFFVDMLYYWFHRFCHQMSFLWASHVVHHQSEEYNLAVALRQGTTQVFFTFFFFLPVVFLGFPTEMFIACYVIGIIYQFWIHTRFVGKLGPIEWIFNTPSHHRVHHGRNPKYLDKNHAGVFIIWDRMFGTFQVEEEEPTYGITKEVKSWNPLWQNIHEYRDFFRNVIKTRKFKDKIKLFYKDPGWFPDDLKEANAEVFGLVERKKYNPKISKSLGIYAIIQFIIAMSVFQLSMDYIKLETTSQFHAIAIAFLYILTLTNLGGMLDTKKWAWFLEIFRIVIICIVGILVIRTNQHPGWTVYIVASIGLVSFPWLISLKAECVK